MTATTYPQFNDSTEAVDVAKAFESQVHGKTVLVTGVNRNGIGFTTAEAFASQSAAHVIVAGRNLSRLQESIDAFQEKYPNVDYRALVLNLSSQQAVRAAAAEVLSWKDVPAIDIVVNSAGIMNLPERTLSEDGIEMTFATNHIGHFLFTCLIMPKLLESAKRNPKGATRVVNVSSLSPMAACMRWSDVNFEKVTKTLPESEQPSYELMKQWGIEDPENKSYLSMAAYNQSKVANLLFSIGANDRLFSKHGILSLTVHPGVIPTELGRNFSKETMDSMVKMAEAKVFTFRTLGAGAATSVTAALDPKLSKPEAKNGKENWGAWLMDCQITDMAHPLSESNEEAEKLWKLSEEMVKEKFTWD